MNTLLKKKKECRGLVGIQTMTQEENNKLQKEKRLNN